MLRTPEVITVTAKTAMTEATLKGTSISRWSTRQLHEDTWELTIDPTVAIESRPTTICRRDIRRPIGVTMVTNREIWVTSMEVFLRLKICSAPRMLSLEEELAQLTTLSIAASNLRPCNKHPSLQDIRLATRMQTTPQSL